MWLPCSSEADSGLLQCQGLDLEFKTFPDPGRCGQRFRSWWIGDSGYSPQDGPLKHPARDAAVSFTGGADMDAMNFLGDNAYWSGRHRDYERNFFPSYCRQLSRLPLFPTLGNHDHYSAKTYPEMSGPYFDYFIPGHPTKSSYRSHYSYQHGRVHVVMLDLGYEPRAMKDKKVFEWLEDDLTAAREGGDTDWIIVANHYAFYTKTTKDSDRHPRNIMARKKLVPVLDKHGVDVSVTAHSHGYERSHLLLGHYGNSKSLKGRMILERGTGVGSVYHKARCGASGTVHVVTGSAGGSATEKNYGNNHAAHDVSSLGVCTLVIEINGSELVSTCVGADGSVVDSFTLHKDMKPAECPGTAVTFGPRKCRQQHQSPHDDAHQLPQKKPHQAPSPSEGRIHVHMTRKATRPGAPGGSILLKTMTVKAAKRGDEQHPGRKELSGTHKFHTIKQHRHRQNHLYQRQKNAGTDEAAITTTSPVAPPKQQQQIASSV